MGVVNSLAVIFELTGESAYYASTNLHLAPRNFSPHNMQFAHGVLTAVSAPVRQSSKTSSPRIVFILSTSPVSTV